MSQWKPPRMKLLTTIIFCLFSEKGRIELQAVMLLKHCCTRTHTRALWSFIPQAAVLAKPAVNLSPRQPRPQFKSHYIRDRQPGRNVLHTGFPDGLQQSYKSQTRVPFYFCTLTFCSPKSPTPADSMTKVSDFTCVRM